MSTTPRTARRHCDNHGHPTGDVIEIHARGFCTHCRRWTDRTIVTVDTGELSDYEKGWGPAL